MDITIFDELVNFLMGVRPEEFLTIYDLIIYYTECMVRMALFGYCMRFFANLVAMPFRGGGMRFFS